MYAACAAKPKTALGDVEQEVIGFGPSIYRSPMFQTWPCKVIVFCVALYRS